MFREQRELETRLEQMRKGIIARMSSGKQKIRENTGKEIMGSGLEIGEFSVFQITSHLNFCHMESCGTILAQLDDALKRLRNGAYGFCALCDERIGMRRLRVIPFAVHCRECQEYLERCKRRQSAESTFQDFALPSQAREDLRMNGPACLQKTLAMKQQNEGLI